MDVLIVTKSDDNESVAMVGEALASRGARAIRLDTDLFPQELRLSTSYGPEGERRFLRTADGKFSLEQVDAVYYRRFAAGVHLPDSLGDTWQACYQESRMHLYGTIAALSCFKMDPIRCVRRADYKEHQLRVARQLGIECPATLFSNDPDTVLEFIARTRGQVITKMQSQFAIYRGGEENVVFTNRFKPDDLANLDGLRFSPMTFQEMVPKKLELRVTVVGHRVFAAAIDSSQSEAAKVDWRRDGHGLIDRWEPYEFPAEEAEKLKLLASHYGLNYGAADYILTPDGRLVFLEINAAGEWFWIQLGPKLPIAEALAEVLVSPAARRCDHRNEEVAHAPGSA